MITGAAFEAVANKVRDAVVGIATSLPDVYGYTPKDANDRVWIALMSDDLPGEVRDDLLKRAYMGQVTEGEYRMLRDTYYMTGIGVREFWTD